MNIVPGATEAQLSMYGKYHRLSEMSWRLSTTVGWGCEDQDYATR